MSLDPNRPIYRIYPLWFFEEALGSRQLVLVSPRRWEDPYENLAELTMLEDQSVAPFKQESLQLFLYPVYAQCWSMTAESDALLRAYSRVEIDSVVKRNKVPHLEGVKVRSTPAKIRAAVDAELARRATLASTAGMKCFIEAVQYRNDVEIQQFIANLVGHTRLTEVGQGQLRASLAFLKRPEFHHEAEVRVVVVDEKKNNRDDILRIPFDPNVVFEEVTFDPRLIPFEREERKANAQKLGYKGPFPDSMLYQGVLLQVPFKNGWKE
jgi:hypothetical protein